MLEGALSGGWQCGGAVSGVAVRHSCVGCSVRALGPSRCGSWVLEGALSGGWQCGGAVSGVAVRHVCGL